MNINWSGLEECLYELIRDDIKRFAETHKHETFYGFALDCNSEYGNVLLCFNSPESLKQQAEKYASDRPNKAAFDKISQKLHEDSGRKIPLTENSSTVEAEELKLRWSTGDWKYQGFNSTQFDEGWDEYETEVMNACMDEEEDEETFKTPTQELFMKSICRVLLRLEKEKIFDVINRTSDFKSYVADHDESKEESWDRLETLRRESEVL
ncbi:DUF4303 domain-containing protein [uncultured Rubinisphaera sp.]|uniref:DUF4303 domain-containing protein n=1 Tax=uncultured Rubinisphaera sp. TaxID=1678686 RepID=UPI0030D81965